MPPLGLRAGYRPNRVVAAYDASAAAVRARRHADGHCVAELSLLGRPGPEGVSRPHCSRVIGARVVADPDIVWRNLVVVRDKSVSSNNIVDSSISVGSGPLMYTDFAALGGTLNWFAVLIALPHPLGYTL